ncbi:MAG TPA: ABC transporter substrate-binding protein [Myxococcaceae bacterium]|nr:ABC transporter substrate-binding protein [Myxococcaceae bacterium]
MRRRVGLGLLVGLTLNAGCRNSAPPLDAGVPDAGPRAYIESEPNDRAEQALTLEGNASVSAGLGADPSKPDEDWYRLAPPTPRRADLRISGVPGADVALEVLDRDRNRMVSVNSASEGQPERLPHLTVRDPLYVRVYSARKGAGGAYTLQLTWAEEGSGTELEPNDRAADSNGLTLAQSISGTVGHAADEDWYRVELVPGAADGGAPAAPPVIPEVELPTDGSGEVAVAGGALDGSDGGAAPTAEVPSVALRLELSAVAGVRSELRVLSAAEAPLFGVKGKEGEPLSLRNVGVRLSDPLVYVVVRSTWEGTGKNAKRGYNPDVPYSLTVSREEAGTHAELEPNDERVKATPLPLQGFREGFLSPKTDVDHYVLRTDRPTLARFQLSGVERLDLSLSVLTVDETGKETVRLRVNEGLVKEPEVLNSVYCERECWVRVEGSAKKVGTAMVRDYENTEQPYRLTVASAPDDGSAEREPNNDAAGATALVPGRAQRGTIHPKRDVDFYRLDLSTRQVKTPLLLTLTGILKVDVGLYLHRLGEDGQPELVQTADRAKGEASEVIRYAADPGVYLLEVRDSKGRESNFQDAYQLTVEETG